MSDNPPDAQTWIGGTLFLALAAMIGYTLPPAETRTDEAALLDRGPPKEMARAGGAARSVRQAPVPSRPTETAFASPPESAVPDNEFGRMVRLGERIFQDTQANAKEFVGNDLRCSSCHLDRGRLANAAPLWGAYVAYPAYREKDRAVDTFAERIQGCFQYSMNGRAPPLGDRVLVAIESYAYFLATGAPVAGKLPGRGYSKLPEPANLDFARGRQIYAEKCALCHGPNGQGQTTAAGKMVFPPLWGERSYNWGAGMSSIANAAAFIKANMPLSQGNTLSDLDAWDVATFIDSQERPQDPRFNGFVAETRKEHHDSRFDMYGQMVNGAVLGEHSPPSGTIPP